MSNSKQIEPGPGLNLARIKADLLQRWEAMSPSDRAAFEKDLDESYPGGFNERDEANALIAMAVRNGPIETLHAGKHSALLEDTTLSRISDEEMRVLMLNATRVLAAISRFRTAEPELYRRWIKLYGSMYCRQWEREQ